MYNLVLELLEKLMQVCKGQLVITGIPLSGGVVANAGRDLDGSIFWVKRHCQSVSYPGTGDIFASVLLGELLGGTPFASACEKAADFISLLITQSAKLATPTRFGVALEPYLGYLTRQGGENHGK